MSDSIGEYVDPKTLVPWEENPRINDHVVDQLAATIKELGFSDPIVARTENRMVIAGHTRLKAALKLGLEVVPVRWMDVTDLRARQLAIASNKLGERAAWDDGVLSEVLRQIASDAPEFDSQLLGFSSVELDKLIGDAGSWQDGDDVSSDEIGDYDPDKETFVVKIEKISAADKDRILALVNASLVGTGYAGKVF
mgnify:CR=1 FL=1